MDQNFSLMAQSRANYYTAGSPIQFVRVELLKGDVTGEIAVCLTFKNVGTEPVTGLVIHFKCKDAAGQILCEDDFYFEQLNVQPGEMFGSDDAVYVSDTPVSSVEIEQDRAFLNGRGVDLRGYKRVRLQTPRVLPNSLAKILQQRTGNAELTCVPQDTEQGWFCACGAFHPNEENTTVCSECGGDRAYIKASLTSILEEARRMAEQQQREINAVVDPAAATAAAAQEAIKQQVQQPAPAPVQEPTAQFDPRAARAQQVDEEEERVRRYAPKGRLFDEDEEGESTRMFDTEETDTFDYDEEEEEQPRGRYADDEEESEDDVMAENIIRWAPPITAIVCALIIAVSLVYHFVLA
ncbi:MAG: hypothetical protein ACI4OI_04340 [Gemmiger sp.]